MTNANERDLVEVNDVSNFMQILGNGFVTVMTRNDDDDDNIYNDDDDDNIYNDSDDDNIYNDGDDDNNENLH